MKQVLNSCLLEVVAGCHIKFKLVAKVSVPLLTLPLQYGPAATSETANICILMASLFLI